MDEGGQTLRCDDVPPAEKKPGLRELISLHIHNWREVATHLGFETCDLDYIDQRHSSDFRSCKRSMFGEWRRKAEKPTRKAVAHALLASGNPKTAKDYCSKHGIDVKEAEAMIICPIQSTQNLGSFNVLVSGQGEKIVPLIYGVLNVEPDDELHERFILDMKELMHCLQDKKWQEVLLRLTYKTPSLTLLNNIDVGEVPEVRQIAPLLLGKLSFHVISFDLSDDLESPVKTPVIMSSHDQLPYHSREPLKEVVHQSLHSVNSQWALTGNAPDKSGTLVVATCSQITKSRLSRANTAIKKSIQSCEPCNSSSTVKYCNDRSMIFPYNAFEDDDRSRLGSVMEKACKQRKYSEVLPLSWNKFILLCTYYQGILPVDQCQALANECGIPNEEFISVLKFVHEHFSTILYYADVSGMNDLVICDPDVLFQSLSWFIAAVLQTSPNVRSDGFVNKLSIQEIHRRQKKPEEEIPAPYLVELLAHFNLVSELKTDKTVIYFMPFLLHPKQQKSVDSQDLLHMNPQPFIIQFSKGTSPSYLFPSLVTRLSLVWPLCEKLQRWRNHMRFMYPGDQIIVELIEHADGVEIQLSGDSDHCTSVVDVHIAKEVLQKVCLSISKLWHSLSGCGCFYCPKSLQINVKPHYAAASKSQPYQLLCKHFPPCVLGDLNTLLPGHRVWLKEAHAKNDWLPVPLNIMDETKENRELGILQHHLAEQGFLEVRVVKSVLYGPPGVGKTSTKRRIVREITNLTNNSCSPHGSTGIEKASTIHLFHQTERTSLLLSVSDPDWSPRGIGSQMEVLLHRILSQDASSMLSFQCTKPSPISSRSSSQTTLSASVCQATEESSFTMDVQQSSDGIHSQLNANSNPALVEVNAVPPAPTAVGHAADILPNFSLSSTKSLELPKFVKKILNDHSWEAVNDSLLEMEDFTIMHITDIGGQPEFQDILPALIEGPALHLIFLNLAKKLDDRCEILYRKEDGKPTSVDYMSEFTVKEMLYQLLSGIASSGSAAALLIGTHLDQVDGGNVQELDRNLHCLLAGFLQHDLVKTFRSQDGQRKVIFPVDNKEGSESEIQHLHNLLQETVEQNFHPVKVPTSWLLFHLVLREQYEVNPGYCTMKECQEIASCCGVSETNVPDALQFLHKKFGTILYYHDVTSMQNVIICDPNVLFKPITQLIGVSFGANPGRPNMSERIRCTGEIPEDIIKEVSDSRISCGPLSYEHILDLLKQRSIISQIRKPDHDTMYFMPCLLRSDPEVGNEDMTTLLKRNPSPLVITFRTGYVPMGLFPTLVVKLSHCETWNLDDSDRYKNRITFIVDESTVARVELQSHLSHLEIRIEDSKHCVRVLSDVVKALNEVKQVLNHTRNLKYNVGFHCPENPSPPHTTICLDIKNPQMMNCACPSRSCKVLPQHGVWFPNYQEPMEVESQLPFKSPVNSATENMQQLRSDGHNIPVVDQVLLMLSQNQGNVFTLESHLEQQPLCTGVAMTSPPQPVNSDCFSIPPVWNEASSAPLLAQTDNSYGQVLAQTQTTPGPLPAQAHHATSSTLVTQAQASTHLLPTQNQASFSPQIAHSWSSPGMLPSHIQPTYSVQPTPMQASSSQGPVQVQPSYSMQPTQIQTGYGVQSTQMQAGFSVQPTQIQASSGLHVVPSQMQASCGVQPTQRQAYSGLLPTQMEAGYSVQPTLLGPNSGLVPAQSQANYSLLPLREQNVLGQPPVLPETGTEVIMRREFGKRAKNILLNYAQELPRQLETILVPFKGMLVQEGIVEMSLSMQGVSTQIGAEMLYSTIMTYIESNPFKFSKLVNILESFPTLTAIAKELEEAGKNAGLFGGDCPPTHT